MRQPARDSGGSDPEDVFSSPVISGGVVNIGSDDGHVYALE